jgi:hypothetical protein
MSGLLLTYCPKYLEVSHASATCVAKIRGLGHGEQLAMSRAEAAVTSTLVPFCVAPEKADATTGKKLGELRAITSSYEQTDFVMKAGWATFPGTADPNRNVAEACASALVKTAAAK